VLLATPLGAAAAQVPEVPEPQEPIRDNSFLIEEAYNQESGVVQHITTVDRAEGGAWEAAFTQEWPLGGIRNQIGFTVPLLHSGPGETGVGDLALNFRHQLVGSSSDDAGFVAPRLTVTFPTGNEAAGRGSGAVGFELNLPVSLEMARWFVVHLNAGASIVPNAKSAVGDEATTSGVALGGSVVWLPHPKFNFLAEVLWERASAVVGPDTTAAGESAVLSPGVRMAIDVGGLQIVPGVAYAIGIGPSKGEDALLLYLSLEHPFK
jgi:hypothetical protein